MVDWKLFSIHMLTETDFRILGKRVPDDDWTEVHSCDKWSAAITVYRKMVDLNWRWG